VTEKIIAAFVFHARVETYPVTTFNIY